MQPPLKKGCGLLEEWVWSVLLYLWVWLTGGLEESCLIGGSQERDDVLEIKIQGQYSMQDQHRLVPSYKTFKIITHATLWRYYANIIPKRPLTPQTQQIFMNFG